MKTTPIKRFASLLLVTILMCNAVSVAGIALIAEREVPGGTSSTHVPDGPFALMYDSDETLAEEIAKLPTFELEMRVSEEDATHELEAGSFASAREKAEVVLEEASSLARTGQIEELLELELSTEAGRMLERLVEESGESRFIVKYNGAVDRTVLSSITSNGTSVQLGDNTYLLSLEERVNPKELADELKMAGFAREIEYIQPDFALSIDSFSLELIEEPGEALGDIVEGTDEITESPDVEGEPVEELEELPEELVPLKEEPVALTAVEPIPVLVAIIDTGIDGSHPLLEGYLTDGWNFIDDTVVIYDKGNPLASAHGTHIAGIVAQTASDYDADVTIMPLKVFENGAAYTSDIIAAIQYADAAGADIINCSFGSTNENPALYEAIAVSDALFVAAAGNSRRDLDEIPSYPACYDLDNMLSVASSNSDGGFSYYSNYSTTLVDITAVGREVVSAIPGGEETGPMTGTSMAAAQVTAGAAVVKSTAVLYDSEVSAEPVELAPDETDDTATVADESGLSVFSEPGVLGNTLDLSSDGLEVIDIGKDETKPIAPKTIQLPAMTTAELKERILSGADMLSNLENKVVDGRYLNVNCSLLGIDGEYRENDPEDDFDVHGYQPTTEELWQMYSAAGVVVQVAAGLYHSLALKEDGTVWAWGRNHYGQLGNGTTTDSSSPVQVIGLTDVISISAGQNHNFAIKSNGTLWAWGNNHNWALGDGSSTDRSTPVQVMGLTNIVSAAGGSSHSLAADSSGSVWAWGDNYCGQLGGITWLYYCDTPTEIPGLTNVTEVAAGQSHCMALDQNGSVWAWGNNDFGQTGNSTLRYSQSVALQVSGLTNIVSLAAGSWHSLAIKSDGSAWAWGDNGLGGMVNQTTPIQVSASNEVIVDIAGGGDHSLEVDSDGKAYSWGENFHWQLGGTTWLYYTSYPMEITALTGVVKVAAGGYHSLALKSDGTVWAWGCNEYGQVGSGSIEDDQYTPVQVGDYTASIEINNEPQIMATGYLHSVAVRADGTVWAWGRNNYGQLGNGTTTTQAAPVQINGLMGVVEVAAGYYHSVAVKSDGTVWTWGYNNYGQLGDGTTATRTSPVQVGGLTNVVSVSAGDYHCVALKADGTMWAWGYNTYGQLGDGTTTTRKTPVQVSSLTAAVSIAAGTYHSMAIKSDGTAWAWGYNPYYQLGDGTTTNRTTPVQVSGLTDVVDVDGGYYHSVAIKADGTVWAWGRSNYGQVGSGTTTTQTAPAQVNSLTGVVSITAGYYHTAAVKTDGTVWSWGYNNYGQLGDGTTTTRTTPVQASSLTGTVAVATGYYHNLALKDDGTVRAWGYNNYGQLGDGTTTDRSTPVQADIVLMDLSGLGSGSEITLDVMLGDQMHLAVKGTDITSFQNMVITITYDETKLQLTNAAAQLYDTHTTTGAIPGTVITITSVSAGELKLTIDKTIPQGKQWSGVITVLKFEAIATGTAELAVS